jgi:hypothetical protein
MKDFRKPRAALLPVFQKLLRSKIFAEFFYTDAAAFGNLFLYLLAAFGNPFLTAIVASKILFNQ